MKKRSVRHWIFWAVTLVAGIVAVALAFLILWKVKGQKREVMLRNPLCRLMDPATFGSAERAGRQEKFSALLCKSQAEFSPQQVSLNGCNTNTTYILSHIGHVESTGGRYAASVDVLLDKNTYLLSNRLCKEK